MERGVRMVVEVLIQTILASFPYLENQAALAMDKSKLMKNVMMIIQRHPLDGCLETMKLKTGWTCSGVPTTCAVINFDGLV
jgi:hypothetical protein